MDNKSNDIYINLVKNPAWQPGSNQPVYVGPPNVDAQKQGKNWRVGVKQWGMAQSSCIPNKDKDGNKVEVE